jgi:predicted nucleic acid-binding Zn ribbon protein
MFPLSALPLQFTGHGNQRNPGGHVPPQPERPHITRKEQQNVRQAALRSLSSEFNKHDKQESFIMAKFYCKYCGNAYSSVQSLTSTTCSRHPDGVGKGRHALYEGDEAPEYTCKYCGKRASTIASLTSQTCPRHPDGNGKGRHSPAL